MARATSVSDSTRATALKALDGMAVIVRKERLTRGEYVSQEVDAEFATAVCGGHKYCAIGSLWAGAGVSPLRDRKHHYFLLPGADQDSREDFLQRRHGLRLAYQAVNNAANRYVARHRLQRTLDHDYTAPIEALFEGNGDVGRTELLRIIASAKREVTAS